MVLQALFVLAGLLSLLAALFDWNWFFETNNAQSVVQRVGRKWARLLYGLLGIILIGVAIFFYLKTIQAFQG